MIHQDILFTCIILWLFVVLLLSFVTMQTNVMLMTWHVRLNAQLLKSKPPPPPQFGDNYMNALDESMVLSDRFDDSIYKIELKLNKAQQSQES